MRIDMISKLLKRTRINILFNKILKTIYLMTILYNPHLSLSILYLKRLKKTFITQVYILSLYLILIIIF